MYFRIFIFILPLVISFSRSAISGDFSFGIVPQQSAKKLAKKWGLVCRYLSQKTGMVINFTTVPDIPEFEDRLVSGIYDFAYMNPYHYVIFSRKPGYRVIAKQKNKKITGIFVVRKNSRFENIVDLSGKTLVFPSPGAFAASMLPRAYLKSKGIHFTPKYVKSHDFVYRNVALGFFDGGGGVICTYLDAEPGIKDKLKVVWQSKSYTPHAIAVHPRVKKETCRLFFDALVKMNTDDDARPLLDGINFNGFVEASDSEYDTLRELKF